jgi:hypothetical protein
MKVYTYSEARQNFSTVLDSAYTEGRVLVRRRDGRVFSIRPETGGGSPFAVPGVKSTVTTAEIIATLREARSR